MTPLLTTTKNKLRVLKRVIEGKPIKLYSEEYRIIRDATIDEICESILKVTQYGHGGWITVDWLKCGCCVPIEIDRHDIIHHYTSYTGEKVVIVK